VENIGGVGKSGVLEHKSGNISETRKDTMGLKWGVRFYIVSLWLNN